MSAYQILSTSCGPRDCKSLNNLTPGRYDVDNFKLFTHRYGRRIAVLINRTYYYLPNRFSKEINSSQRVAELNKGRYIMAYMGRDRDHQNRALIDFIPVTTGGSDDIVDDDDNEYIDISIDTVQ